MYRNPLNNGDISDYNSLKKQRDYGAIVKKYQSRKLKTEPNELQKYYQYMTYQQPILDELNYVAERMKNENIQKNKEDFNFIEDLKIKREQEMKEKSELEKSIEEIKKSLFDDSSTLKSDDMTPTINTDMELEFEEAPEFRRYFEAEERRKSEPPPMLRERTYTEDEIKDRASKAIQARVRATSARKKQNELVEASKAIQERVRASLAGKKQNELVEATTAIQARIRASLAGKKQNELVEANPLILPSPALSKKSVNVLSQADTEAYSNIPRNKRGGGRPKGSKNKPKGRTLDLTK